MLVFHRVFQEIASVEDCCAQCVLSPECLSFTFQEDQFMCVLKGGAQRGTQAGRGISGILKFVE